MTNSDKLKALRTQWLNEPLSRGEIEEEAKRYYCVIKGCKRPRVEDKILCEMHQSPPPSKRRLTMKQMQQRILEFGKESKIGLV